MTMLWPGFLLLLGLIPVLVAVYLWVLRRRRRFAVRYSSLSLLRQALPRQSRWRRHLPFALFLVALASLVGALVRPAAIVAVPSGRATIILALDVSRSMCSTDIAPTRLAAAEAAALSFIRRQPASTQIGIVAFAGFAELVQAPTNDQEVLETAVESLLPARRTAVGSGILKSLDAIAEIDESVPPTVTSASAEPEPTPVPKGLYAPHIIVLLTDGATNAGPLPLEAAQQAAARGIRVYTIGFGTERGGSFGNGPGCRGDFFGGGGGGFGFSGGGGGFRRGIDEETLKEISALTDGEYYEATSANELQEVFNDLPTYLIARHELMEISVIFTALGALFAALAVGLSLLWHPLP